MRIEFQPLKPTLVTHRTPSATLLWNAGEATLPTHTQLLEWYFFRVFVVSWEAR